jgi:hypothetical protein
MWERYHASIGWTVPNFRVVRWRIGLPLLLRVRAAESGPKRRFATTNYRIAKGLFDHLVGGYLQSLRHSEAKRFGGFEIDDEIELDRLDDGKVSRLFAFQNFANIDARLTVSIRKVRSVTDEAAGGSISKIMPTTIAGAGVRARVAMYAAMHWWDEPEADLDADKAHSRLLIEALCAAAGLPASCDMEGREAPPYHLGRNVLIGIRRSAGVHAECRQNRRCARSRPSAGVRTIRPAFFVRFRSVLWRTLLDRRAILWRCRSRFWWRPVGGS